MPNNSNNHTTMKKYYFLGLILCFCNLTLIGQVNLAWEKWIQTNSFGVSIADTNDFRDLSFLKETLKDKKIVFLG